MLLIFGGLGVNKFVSFKIFFLTEIILFEDLFFLVCFLMTSFFQEVTPVICLLYFK